MAFAKPADMPDTTRNPFARLLSRLSVGRKLLLIYLLDLCAVIYVTSILVNEKFSSSTSPARRSRATPTSAPCETR
jgi:hypothetical protein